MNMSVCELSDECAAFATIADRATFPMRIQLSHVDTYQDR